MASTSSTAIITVLPDRPGLDFLLRIEINHPDYKTPIKTLKKTETYYLAYVNLEILEINEVHFRYVEKEASESNKDFLSDKGLFLYITAKLVPQNIPGFVSVSNEYFCTILSAIACVRIKSNKGSHGKSETPNQTRSTDIIEQFHMRIDKVFDCLSKYFLIKHNKETDVWTLENPVIGDCVINFDEEKFSHMLMKLTPQTKPTVRGQKVTTSTKKSSAKSRRSPSPEKSQENVQIGQNNDMEVVDYESGQDHQYVNSSQQMCEPNLPSGVQTIPYAPHMNTNHHNIPPHICYPGNYNFVPKSKIERDTGVPEYVWKMIEEKARSDPMILLKMVNTLIPMRDRILALQQQGRDPKELFAQKNSDQ